MHCAQDKPKAGSKCDSPLLFHLEVTWLVNTMGTLWQKDKRCDWLAIWKNCADLSTQWYFPSFLPRKSVAIPSKTTRAIESLWSFSSFGNPLYSMCNKSSWFRTQLTKILVKYSSLMAWSILLDVGPCWIVVPNFNFLRCLSMECKRCEVLIVVSLPSEI